MLWGNLCDLNSGWYLPSTSIATTFFGGLIIILSFRFILYIKTELKRRATIKNKEEDEKSNPDNEEKPKDQDKKKVNCFTKMQDWAAYFISGKSKFGKPLV